MGDGRDAAVPPQPDRLPHEVIGAKLRELIATLPPGARLPSQAEIMTDYLAQYGRNVSHVTVARAYERLIDEGLVVAQRYVGYFVRTRSEMVWDRTRSSDPQRMRRLAMPNGGVADTWAHDAEVAGYSFRQAITVATVAASTRIGDQDQTLAELFEVGEQALIVARYRVRYIGPADGRPDSPESLADSYYPHSLVGGTSMEDPATINTAALLAELGHEMAEHLEIVSPRVASAREVELLALPRATGVVELLRVSRDAQGMPVLVQHIITPNRLKYRLRGGSARDPHLPPGDPRRS